MELLLLRAGPSQQGAKQPGKQRKASLEALRGDEGISWARVSVVSIKLTVMTQMHRGVTLFSTLELRFADECHFYSVVRKRLTSSLQENMVTPCLQFSTVNSVSLEKCSAFPGGTQSMGTSCTTLSKQLGSVAGTLAYLLWQEARQVPSTDGFPNLLGFPILSHSRDGGTENTHSHLNSFTLLLFADSSFSPRKWDALHPCAAGNCQYVTSHSFPILQLKNETLHSYEVPGVVTFTVRKKNGGYQGIGGGE